MRAYTGDVGTPLAAGEAAALEHERGEVEPPPSAASASLAQRERERSVTAAQATKSKTSLAFYRGQKGLSLENSEKI